MSSAIVWTSGLRLALFPRQVIVVAILIVAIVLLTPAVVDNYASSLSSDGEGGKSVGEEGGRRGVEGGRRGVEEGGRSGGEVVNASEIDSIEINRTGDQLMKTPYESSSPPRKATSGVLVETIYRSNVVSDTTWLLQFTSFKSDNKSNTNTNTTDVNPNQTSPFVAWLDDRGNYLLELTFILSNQTVAVNSYYYNRSNVLSNQSQSKSFFFGFFPTSTSAENDSTGFRFKNFSNFSCAINATSAGFLIFFDDKLQVNYTHRLNWLGFNKTIFTSDLSLRTVILPPFQSHMRLGFPSSFSSSFVHVWFATLLLILLYWLYYSYYVKQCFDSLLLLFFFNSLLSGCYLYLLKLSLADINLEFGFGLAFTAQFWLLRKGYLLAILPFFSSHLSSFNFSQNASILSLLADPTLSFTSFRILVIFAAMWMYMLKCFISFARFIASRNNLQFPTVCLFFVRSNLESYLFLYFLSNSCNGLDYKWYNATFVLMLRAHEIIRLPVFKSLFGTFFGGSFFVSAFSIIVKMFFRLESSFLSILHIVLGEDSFTLIMLHYLTTKVIHIAVGFVPALVVRQCLGRIMDNALVTFFNPDFMMPTTAVQDAKIGLKRSISYFGFIMNISLFRWREVKCICVIAFYYSVAILFCVLYKVEWHPQDVLWSLGHIHSDYHIFLSSWSFLLLGFHVISKGPLNLYSIAWRLLTNTYVSFVVLSCAKIDYKLYTIPFVVLQQTYIRFIGPFIRSFFPTFALGLQHWRQYLGSLSNRTKIIASSLVVVAVTIYYIHRSLTPNSERKGTKIQKMKSNSNMDKSSTSINDIMTIIPEEEEQRRRMALTDILVRCGFDGDLGEIKRVVEKYDMASLINVKHSGHGNGYDKELEGHTCLSAACMAGRLEVIEYLTSSSSSDSLSASVDVNVIIGGGDKGIRSSSSSMTSSLASLLTSLTTSISISDAGSLMTPLTIACRENNSDVIEKLIDSGKIDISVADQFEITSKWAADVSNEDDDIPKKKRIATKLQLLKVNNDNDNDDKDANSDPDSPKDSFLISHQEAADQLCIICGCEEPMIRCPANPTHVFCQLCFQHMVKVQCVKCEGHNFIDSGEFACTYCTTSKKVPIGIPIGIFSGDCIKVFDKDTLAAYEGARALYIAARERNRMFVQNERRDVIIEKLRQEHLHLLGKISTAELFVHKIQADVLTVKCPHRHCGVVFQEWTSCFAVQCAASDGKNSYGCKGYFCGWCLGEFSNTDTCHAHVKVCPLSLHPGSYFCNTNDNQNFRQGLRARHKLQETKMASYLNNNTNDLTLEGKMRIIELLDMRNSKGDPSYLEYHFLEKDEIKRQLREGNSN